MIYKNCALLKKSFSTIALVGALSNTMVCGMDQKPQSLSRNHGSVLTKVPTDIWNQTDNILGIKNIKGRNTIEKVLLLKETISKPQQYDLKNKSEEFTEKLLTKAKEFNIFFGVKVDFKLGAQNGGGFEEAKKFFKAAKKLNIFVNLKCENWPRERLYALLANTDATQVANLDLSAISTKSSSLWQDTSYCGTLKDLGEALGKSNLTNLKALNLASLSFCIKENPFKDEALHQPFVSYLHIDKKMPKLQTLNLKGVKIDRKDQRNWDPEIKNSLDLIERTPRSALGRYSRIKILK